MKKFDDFLEEQMQNQEFKKEYDDLQPEFDVIRAIVDARTSQVTQKQLAEKRALIRQISAKLENGTQKSVHKSVKKTGRRYGDDAEN